MGVASPAASQHFELSELADGAVAAIATDGGWGVGNAGYIDLGDHTVVFDTFVNRVPAAELKSSAEVATGRKVDYVFNSHAHRDHVRGNQVFVDAEIVATSKTRDLMAGAWKARTERILKEGMEQMRMEVLKEFDEWKSNPLTDEADVRLWDGYMNGILEGLGSYHLKLPTVTFDSTFTVRGSKGSVTALTYGGGHSASDLILYLPEERIVFLGDLLFIGYQPYLGDGDPEELLRTLDRVEALDPSKVVPGHGPVGTKNDLSSTRDYVETLKKTVAGVGESGAGLESLAGKPEPEPFNKWKWHAFYRDNLKFLSERNDKTD